MNRKIPWKPSLFAIASEWPEKDEMLDPKTINWIQMILNNANSRDSKQNKPREIERILNGGKYKLREEKEAQY